MKRYALARRMRRVGLATVVLVTLAGCTQTADLVEEVAPPPTPTVATTPGPGAKDVSPSEQITLNVTDGSLDTVALTSNDGKMIPGLATADGRTWTTTQPLEFGKTYTWAGTAKGAKGTSTPVQGSFSTVKPDTFTDATFNISQGQTVGVAAPVIIDFDTVVHNKAAIEKSLDMWTSKPNEGSWAWLPDTSDGDSLYSRVHWRPRNYWMANTEVRVTANLYGVPFGNGAYGNENMNLTFNIGRNQVTRGDISTHQLTVFRDGVETASYPASFGVESVADRNTRGGIHVVSAKAEVQRMVSEQYGYDENHPWAVRISNNGEFIHTNTGSVGSQGSANVSHGCINLSSSNGQEYFESAMYGDPVEIYNSNVPLTADDGDIYDWTIPWEQWRTMSALHQPDQALAVQAPQAHTPN